MGVRNAGGVLLPGLTIVVGASAFAREPAGGEAAKTKKSAKASD